MDGETDGHKGKPAGAALSHLEFWRAPDGGGLVCRVVYCDGRLTDEFLHFDAVELADIVIGLRRMADGGDEADSLQRELPARPPAISPPPAGDRRVGWQGSGNGPKRQVARADGRPLWIGEVEDIMADASWPPAVGE